MATKPAKTAAASKPCYSCGMPLVVADLPPSSPTLNRAGKYCPRCNAPMDAVAVDNTAFEASNPADPKDTLRTTLRDQALADVASMTD